jgi:hypothetical protein
MPVSQLVSYSKSSTNHADSVADYMLLSRNAVDQILDLYPDDPTQGVPLNTGEGVLPTGLQDKRVRLFSAEILDISSSLGLLQSAAFFGDAVIIASRRAVAKAFSTKNKVFSYRFNQPAYTVPMTTGGASTPIHSSPSMRRMFMALFFLFCDQPHTLRKLPTSSITQ